VPNVPNLITGLRFALIPVLAVLLITRRYEAAFGLFVVSALSDLADGFIARRWNLATRFGAIADPVADKLTMLTVALVLASQSLVPVWLAAAIVARDILIVAGALAFQLLIGRVDMAPSTLSKFNTVLEFAVLAALLADAALVVEATAWIEPLFIVLLLTIAASGAHYVWVWGRRAWRARRANDSVPDTSTRH
jgi:cardiolipin synthase